MTNAPQPSTQPAQNNTKHPLSLQTMESIAAEMKEMHNHLNGGTNNASNDENRDDGKRDEGSAVDEGNRDDCRSSHSSNSYRSERSSGSGSSRSRSFSSSEDSFDSSESESESDDSDSWSSSQHNDESDDNDENTSRAKDNFGTDNSECIGGTTSTTFRRRRPDHSLDNTNGNRNANAYALSNSSSRDSKLHKQKHKRKSRSSSSELWFQLPIRQIQHHLAYARKSTKLLYVSFVFWVSIQMYIIFIQTSPSQSRTNHNPPPETRGYSGRQLKSMEKLRREAKQALGTAADFEEEYTPSSGKPNRRRHRKSRSRKNSDEEGNTRTERLREGCAPLEWHTYHFPNCNEIHEIDLKTVVRKRRFGVERGWGEEDDNSLPWGFVGNGLWRDVFSCDPRQEVDKGAPPPVVLKMMKSEHAYDQRNFQRHRRDALVMELLSSSHHLVPIYGYCANTVLTQAISHTLDDVIYAREKERVRTWSPNGGFKTKPKIETWMGRDENGELLATRESEVGRIKLALGVFRGLMDLHEGVGYKNKDGKEVEWLPIIHADLQAKQYLIDSSTGQIYLNDFNRCRFVTKKEKRMFTDNAGADESASASLDSCPVFIPTAPGASRSPEEYDSAPLSEKLDVYSAGNILFGIITGERPWDDERGRHIKERIQMGDRPEVNESIRSAEGTVDAELTKLLDRVYEGDPIERASAKDIVHELEALLEKQLN